MTDFLYTLLRSLNRIEVHGKDNMEIMVGCIYAIEHELAKINAEEEAPGEDAEEHNVR